MDVVPEGAQVADEHRAGCSVPSSMLGKRKRRPQRETPHSPQDACCGPRALPSVSHHAHSTRLTKAKCPWAVGRMDEQNTVSSEMGCVPVLL